MFDKKSEWSKDRAEKLLLSRIITVINRYDWSVGFYSTGIRAYSAVKDKVVGRDSDLIQLQEQEAGEYVGDVERLRRS